MSDKTNEEKLRILQERLAQINQKKDISSTVKQPEEEIIKITNWITKLSPGFKNCGNMVPKNTQAFGLRKATKKPSLNNERLLFAERFLSKSKFFENLTRSKAMYNKYKIPAHLK